MNIATAFSVPSAQALSERVLSKYDLPAATTCQFLHFGVNETYRVEAGKKTYFLRVYRKTWRSRGEVEAEVDTLLYLRRHRLPVSSNTAKKRRVFDAHKCPGGRAVCRVVFCGSR